MRPGAVIDKRVGRVELGPDLSSVVLYASDGSRIGTGQLRLGLDRELRIELDPGTVISASRDAPPRPGAPPPGLGISETGKRSP